MLDRVGHGHRFADILFYLLDAMRKRETASQVTRPFVALGATVNRCDVLREVPRHLLQRDCAAPLAPD
eukprot:5272383-Prorocentrum_lima.AAC.1